MLGVIGRQTGQIRLGVPPNTEKETLQTWITDWTEENVLFFTDEATAYNWLSDDSRLRTAICHEESYAEDRDGDGHCEVHVNTIEGIWTGLRNRLRTFRGVHKKYLDQYVAVFQMAYNFQSVDANVLRRMCGCSTQP